MHFLLGRIYFIVPLIQQHFKRFFHFFHSFPKELSTFSIQYYSIVIPISANKNTSRTHGSEGVGYGINSLVSFLVIGDDLTNIKLEEVFHTLMYIDIGLFVASLIAMFVEAMFILRKNSDV